MEEMRQSQVKDNRKTEKKRKVGIWSQDPVSLHIHSGLPRPVPSPSPCQTSAAWRASVPFLLKSAVMLNCKYYDDHDPCSAVSSASLRDFSSWSFESYLRFCYCWFNVNAVVVKMTLTIWGPPQLVLQRGASNNAAPVRPYSWGECLG